VRSTGQDLTHALEVEPARRQILNVVQDLEVLVAVAAAAPHGAGRVDEALALVDPERLGVHAGQLGRHRDDVDGA
jgi:hypothetical protein